MTTDYEPHSTKIKFPSIRKISHDLVNIKQSFKYAWYFRTTVRLNVDLSGGYSIQTSHKDSNYTLDTQTNCRQLARQLLKEAKNAIGKT